MNRATFFFLSILVMVSCAGVMSWAYVNQRDTSTEMRSAAQKAGRDYVFVKGIKATQYVKDDKIFSVSIGLLRIAPKRLGFFSVNLFQVVELYNTELHVYLDETGGVAVEGTPQDSERIAEGIVQVGRSLMGKERKNLVGVEIRNIKVNFYRNKVLQKTVIGRQASFEQTTHDLVFQGDIILTTSASRSLCRNARWNLHSNNLTTSGQCVQLSI